MKLRSNTLALGLAGAAVLAGVAWLVGRGIRSPAQIAADTAPPKPSLITVPVERRSLATEVIVRGMVRYGSARAVALAASSLKPGSSIISKPARPGLKLHEGSVAMSVSARPVFVLRGAEPMHRDLGPGTAGTDVRQLEEALARVGFSPGAVDGRYDAATEQAVTAWYQKGGWTPFGATDAQLDQIRVARTAAATANDAVLQAELAVQTAKRKATPVEVSQARVDAATAADGVQSARAAVVTARTKAEAARDTAAHLAAVAAGPGIPAKVQADIAAVDADVASKQAALTTATDAQAEAQRRVDQAPPETPPADLETLRTTLRQAIDAVPVARQALEAAKSASASARASAPSAGDQAGTDARAAARDARLADAERVRANQTLVAAKRQAALAQARVTSLTSPGDTALQRRMVAAAQSTSRRAAADVATLATKAGVQVPADEILFFPTLPLRVDTVKLKLGDTAAGRVMTVSSSQLTADSSLAINDAKLVRVGAPVVIEEQDLGIKVAGTVTRVADKPGTDKAEPTRVYFEVTPKQAPARLVGASVKLTIAVKTTRGAVLAVPLSALSVGAGGSSRVQVDRGGGKTDYVPVVPGLVANGLVEVRPATADALKPGDLVVVGSGGALAPGGSALPGGVPAGGPTPTTTGPGAVTIPGATGGAGTVPGTGTTPGSSTVTGASPTPGSGAVPGTSTSPGAGGGSGTSTDSVPATGASPGTAGATP